MTKSLSKISIVMTLMACSISVSGAEPTMEVRQTASNYYAYPYPELPLPELTATPDGYEPFHMEHYGRHGSRWHIGQWVYRQPIALLRPAERNGKLTPRGKELMAQLRKIEMEARGRDGELTQLGADQHRGIARRMVANFPEIFDGKARIDARSTDVVRCILSMDNELQELKAYNPNLDVTSDASKSTVYYLNYNDKVADSIYHAALPEARKQLGDRYDNDGAFITKLVTDAQFASDSLNVEELFHSLFRIAANAQSHYDQKAPYDLFSEQELHNQWVLDNARWFLQYGNTSYTKGTGPQRQRFLMRNIIESADTSLMRREPSANMRFGHEVVVLPMVVLMDLDGMGREMNDLDSVTANWHNYTMFPMASNIQMIFYRPSDKDYTVDDVLVKVLLNEREVTLPATPVTGPYYRWSDLRRTYLNKIGDGGIPEPMQEY